MLTPTTADLSHNLDSCISNIILPCRCLVSLVKALALLHLIPLVEISVMSQLRTSYND